MPDGVLGLYETDDNKFGPFAGVRGERKECTLENDKCTEGGENRQTTIASSVANERENQNDDDGTDWTDGGQSVGIELGEAERFNNEGEVVACINVRWRGGT